MENKVKSRFREYAESIIAAVILALLIRSFVIQAFKIPSGSMLPTLLVGDHILVNKFIYGTKIPFTDKKVFSLRSPHRGDIIVFRCPVDRKKDFIKRVVGVGGDVVEIKDKVVFINGEPWEDNYGVHNELNIRPGSISARDNFGPVTVPQDSLFTLGDNRDHSHDSRFWGFVDLKEVKGSAFIIYWSWDKNSHWLRWRRIAKLIH
ncbi:MAG: signal peptidase I [Deltaproteobacteria bacterium]|nr:MAG: signal peptidase I [Deltaproteobacteria bacterium]